MAAVLVRANGNQRGQRLKLSQFPTRLGRHPDCEVMLDNGSVSREHARILCEDNNYFLEDLNSRNGTQLNKISIKSRTALADGDLVSICGIEFNFKLQEAEQIPLSPREQPSDQLSIGSSIHVIDDGAPPAPGSGSQILMSGNVPRYDQDRAETKLRALLDIGRDLSGNAAQVLPRILENLMWIFPQADYAYIFLMDKSSKRLDLKAHRTREKSGFSQEVRVSRSILDAVVKSQTAILSDDVSNDSRFDPSESIVNFHINTLMAAPLMMVDGAEVLGVVQVDCRTVGKRFTYDDLDLLVSVAFQMATVYHNSILQETALNEKVMQRELNVAHEVQKCFLPEQPPVVAGYHFYGYYSPAKYLGGDYYDYIPLPDGRLVVTLGDVSGKGAPAALMMAKLSGEVLAALLLNQDPIACVRRLNNQFANPRWESRFITFFFGILDPKTHTLTFVNAGQVAPILLNPDGTFSLFDEKSGTPLGVVEDYTYEETTFTFAPGQSLIVISDGFTDAMNAEDKQWETSGVLNFLKQMKNMPAPQLGEQLVAAVKAFAGRVPQTDDQCLLIVGRDAS